MVDAVLSPRPGHHRGGRFRGVALATVWLEYCVTKLRHPKFIRGIVKIDTADEFAIVAADHGAQEPRSGFRGVLHLLQADPQYPALPASSSRPA